MTNEQKAAAEQTVETYSLKEYFNKMGFVSLGNRIRSNVNGYLYITALKSDRTPENIYFSRRIVHEFQKDQLVDKALVEGLQIAIVKNAAGEERVKLAKKSYNTIDDLF